MVDKLKWNPYPILDTDSEYFNLMAFSWNIDAVKRYIQETDMQTVGVRLNDDFKNWLSWIHVDHDKAMANPCHLPIIMAELYPGMPIVLDGHHRAHRDMHNGKGQIAAYYLPYPLHTRFLNCQPTFKRFLETVRNEVKRQLNAKKEELRKEYGL